MRFKHQSVMGFKQSVVVLLLTTINRLKIHARILSYSPDGRLGPLEKIVVHLIGLSQSLILPLIRYRPGTYDREPVCCTDEPICVCALICLRSMYLFVSISVCVLAGCSRLK